MIGVPAVPMALTVTSNRAARVALGAAWAYCVRYTFKDTLNLVQGIGPAYYIVRDKEDTWFGVTLGFMRETDHPWRRGRGIQFDVPKRSLQIGLCRRRPIESEDDGLLDVLDGRIMETEVEEISQW